MINDIIWYITIECGGGGGGGGAKEWEMLLTERKRKRNETGEKIVEETQRIREGESLKSQENTLLCCYVWLKYENKEMQISSVLMMMILYCERNCRESRRGDGLFGPAKKESFKKTCLKIIFTKKGRNISTFISLSLLLSLTLPFTYSLFLSHSPLSLSRISHFSIPLSLQNENIWGFAFTPPPPPPPPPPSSHHRTKTKETLGRPRVMGRHWESKSAFYCGSNLPSTRRCKLEADIV